MRFSFMRINSAQCQSHSSCLTMTIHNICYVNNTHMYKKIKLFTWPVHLFRREEVEVREIMYTRNVSN